MGFEVSYLAKGMDEKDSIANLEDIDLDNMQEAEDLKDGDDLLTDEKNIEIFGFNPDPIPEQEERSRFKVQAEWQGQLRAIVADHTPSVGLRFYAWRMANKELFPNFTTSQLFSAYVELATYRDALADLQREEKEYDHTFLQLEGLKPLIEAEVRSKQEEIATNERNALMKRLEEFALKGLVKPEVIQAMRAVDYGD